MVCIFMFKAQQHFPGDLAKLAWQGAESQLLLTLLWTALPPASESSWALGSWWGIKGDQLLKKTL